MTTISLSLSGSKIKQTSLVWDQNRWTSDSVNLYTTCCVFLFLLKLSILEKRLALKKKVSIQTTPIHVSYLHSGDTSPLVFLHRSISHSFSEKGRKCNRKSDAKLLPFSVNCIRLGWVNVCVVHIKLFCNYRRKGRAQSHKSRLEMVRHKEEFYSMMQQWPRQHWLN